MDNYMAAQKGTDTPRKYVQDPKHNILRKDSTKVVSVGPKIQTKYPNPLGKNLDIACKDEKLEAIPPNDFLLVPTTKPEKEIFMLPKQDNTTSLISQSCNSMNVDQNMDVHLTSEKGRD